MFHQRRVYLPMHEVRWYGQVVPFVDLKVRALCRLPYQGHPGGCPNWGKRNTCPPDSATLWEIIDEKAPVYCIVSKFDLGTHTNKMRGLHPEWSEKRLRCCLYWQGVARKSLRNKVAGFLQKHPGLRAVYCPEGAGVDVTRTLSQLGISLEWPPLYVACQVALVGTPIAQ
jgi:hypothetical protein